MSIDDLTSSVMIYRTQDPTKVVVELVDSQYRHLELALSNLQEGDADDASILSLASKIVAEGGGSIDGIVGQVADAAVGDG